MCKSKAEGGLRCSKHGKERLEAAVASGNPERIAVARHEYQLTTAGIQELRDNGDDFVADLREEEQGAIKKSVAGRRAGLESESAYLTKEETDDLRSRAMAIKKELFSFNEVRNRQSMDHYRLEKKYRAQLSKAQTTENLKDIEKEDALRSRLDISREEQKQLTERVEQLYVDLAEAAAAAQVAEKALYPEVVDRARLSWFGLEIGSANWNRTLGYIASDPAYQVREAVAEHPGTPTKILDPMKNDESSGVRKRLAANANTSDDAIEHMIEHSNSFSHAYAVADGVLSRPRTSEAIIGRVAKMISIHDPDAEYYRAVRSKTCEKFRIFRPSLSGLSDEYVLFLARRDISDEDKVAYGLDDLPYEVVEALYPE